MCIVIDASALSHVFNPKDKKHPEFAPVLHWITGGVGKVVYGGTKYKEELRRLVKCKGLFKQLKKAGRVVEIEDALVDEAQEKIASMERHRDFDDPHIVAIVVVSKCMLICTDDERSFKFLKDRRFYPLPMPVPRLYTKRGPSDLLCEKYVAEVCRPCGHLRHSDDSIVIQEQ